MKKGFTLLELLIVITILAVLAGAMIPLFKSSKQEAQDAKTMADLDAIKSGSIMYKYDTATWPIVGTIGAVTCLTSTGVGCPTAAGGWNGPYLTDWATDPWTNPYAVYATAGNTLYAQSFGPDGANNTCSSQCTSSSRVACDICVVITADRTK